MTDAHSVRLRSVENHPKEVFIFNKALLMNNKIE